MWISDWDYKLFLEYTKVLLSWPPLALVAFCYFVKVFKDQIGNFLTNGRPKIPGYEPTNPLVSQRLDEPNRPEEEAAAEPIADAPPLAEGNALENAADQMDSQQGSSSRLAAALTLRTATIENFRYLNQLLAIPTQGLLDALVMAGSISISELNSFWSDFSSNTRSNMLTVLYQHGLVNIEDSNILPTKKAEDYTRWPERTAWVNAQKKILLTSTANSAKGNRNILAEAEAGNIFELAAALNSSSASVETRLSNKDDSGNTGRRFHGHGFLGRSPPNKNDKP